LTELTRCISLIKHRPVSPYVPMNKAAGKQV
jgi:hypothetical protein